MLAKKLEPVSAAAAAVTALAAESKAAEDAVGQLLAKIKDKSDKVRYEGISGAGPVGAAAVKPLVQTMADGEMEVARAARRALWNIVRYAGRPKARKESAAVVKELLAALAADAPVNVKRELMWMISELAGDEAVEPIAALIQHKDLREDARMVLQRLPGKKSLAALRTALETAPEEFRPNIAVSLRARGQKVAGYPSANLEPTLQTKVQVLDAAALAQAEKEAKETKQSKRKGKKQ